MVVAAHAQRDERGWKYTDNEGVIEVDEAEMRKARGEHAGCYGLTIEFKCRARSEEGNAPLCARDGRKP